MIIFVLFSFFHLVFRRAFGSMAVMPNASDATNNATKTMDELVALVESLQSQLQSRDATIRLLVEQVRLLRHKSFGRTSESLSPDQLAMLFNEAELVNGAQASAAGGMTGTEGAGGVPISDTVTRRKPGGRRHLPPELPRITVNHDLPDAEKVCPKDGSALHRIGEVVSEQLDIVPMRIQVIRHVRHSYGCRCCGESVKTAALPNQPIPQSMASAGTLAHLAVSKYAEHLPLYRQEQILKRHGLDITRATLAQWMLDLGELVTPLVNLLQDHLLEGSLIQMDETPVQVLKEDGKPATSRSYMWVRRGGPPAHPIILFDYHPSRSGQVAQQLLEGYTGILQTDGYGGYDAVGQLPHIVHAGCIAHARRKFVETVQSLPKAAQAKSEANQAILFIGKLYDIEREMKDADHEARQAARDERSRPVLTQLRQWLESTAPAVPPGSLFGKALHYLHSQWPNLILYVEDGRIPIDTNLVENAIRPFALGRRNWLFSATPKGATASARLFSLIETAKASRIEPYRYLHDVFTKLPQARTVEDYEQLLPWNWTETAGTATILKRTA